MVSDHPAKFNCHRLCGSGDAMILLFDVIFKDHVINGLCDFISMSTLPLCHHSDKFGGHVHCSRGNIMVLVYRITFQEMRREEK